MYLPVLESVSGDPQKHHNRLLYHAFQYLDILTIFVLITLPSASAVSFPSVFTLATDFLVRRAR